MGVLVDFASFFLIVLRHADADPIASGAFELEHLRARVAIQELFFQADCGGLCREGADLHAPAAPGFDGARGFQDFEADLRGAGIDRR